MSFGGSVLNMILTLKNNANMLKKRNAFKEWRNNVLKDRHKSLKFKKVSDEKLQLIKINIWEHARKERRKSILITISILIPIIILLFIFLKFFEKKVVEADKNRLTNKEKILLLKQKERSNLELSVIFYLNKGYKYMENKQYKDAKIAFYKAYELNGSDFSVTFANAKVYVMDCIENKKGCTTAQKLVDGLNQKYKDNYNVGHLTQLFNESK